MPRPPCASALWPARSSKPWPAIPFADEAAWRDHLRRLGITDLEVNPDPVRIATEGALWGAIKGLLPDTVSDDSSRFAIDEHALCWVHAERLIHKLDNLHR